VKLSVATITGAAISIMIVVIMGTITAVSLITVFVISQATENPRT
jgi:hypothetical protein